MSRRRSNADSRTKNANSSTGDPDHSGPKRARVDFDHCTPDQYFDTLMRWLELEGDAERARMARRRQIQSQRDAEATGETIVGLQIVDHKTGLAGRLLVDLAKPGGKPLPMNRLKVGSPVVLSDDEDPSDEGVAGVVSRRKRDTIQVATEKWPEPAKFRLDLSPDETTRRRQQSAIARARMATSRSGQLRDIVLGKRPLREPKPSEEISFLTSLNPPQQDAVRFALSMPDVAILHGPPGTGKTTTLAEVIYQVTRRGGRVLACAPSNTAVDNLLERLVAMIPNVLRIGHPARVFEGLRGHTLDEQVDSDPSTQVVKEMRREIDELLRTASKFRRSREFGRRRGEIYAEVGQLRGQIRSLERSVVRNLIASADVICTTTTIDDDLLGNSPFEWVVIDEACQCTEPSVWQALQLGERVLMAGDHCQLPPTVLSDIASREGMRDSMMQRLIGQKGDSIFRRLTVQYRMHEAIMSFSSNEFYDGELIADASVRSHRLCDLETIGEQPLTSEPLELIDTAGAGFEEQKEADGESKQNPGEARVVTKVVGDLIDSGIQPEQIAIIAPYAAQVRLLRNRIDLPGLEIDTVDGFQGREKEVIVITMVRSNESGEIGFLADTRRSNVALTRARRKLIVIGDSATLANEPFYARMLEYFESRSSYHSVWEYVTV